MNVFVEQVSARGRLLLVEDNPADAELVREYFLDSKEEVPELEVVDTLGAALRRLRSGENLTAVLLDLNLPDSTGLETLERVVAIQPDAPVIVLTGAGTASLGTRAVARGAADFLPKDELTGRLLLRSIRYAAERARRRGAEARYQALVYNARDLIAIVDPDLTIRYVSPSIERVLGFSPDEKEGASAALDVHPDDQEVVARELDRLLSDPAYVSHVKYRLAHKSGGWRTLDTIAQNCIDDPSIRGLIVSSRDVTEIHEAQEAAATTTRQLRRTLGALHDAVFTVIPEGRKILDCNQAAEAVFGYRIEEMVGRSTRILHVDEASFRRFSEESSGAVRQNGSYHTEFEMRRENGETFPAEVTVSVLDPQAGPDRGVVSVVRDVSERVGRSRQMRFQSALLERVGQPVLAVDARARLTYWNRAAAELTGFTWEEVRGREILDLLVAEEDMSVARAAQETATSEGRWEGEIRLRTKTGGTVTVQATATSAVNPDGSPGGRIWTGIDLTERIHLEDRLRQAEKMEAVGRLAAGVAHDFNNLLTAVEGHATFLLDELESDSFLREDAEEIRNAGRRAAELTRRLLAFSRKQAVQRRNVDLGRALVELATMLRRLVPERIDLDVAVAAESVIIRADPTQLHQIVMNLVVNAVDAIEEEGRVRLTVDQEQVTADDRSERTPELEPGLYARLTVTDTGCGMSPEVLRHAFEPFFTTKSEGHGTGLGLSTVFGIVKQSGGHTFVRSEPGRGTTFEILLPRMSAESDDPRHETHLPTTRLDTVVVLLAEDEAAVRNVARRVLVRAGCTVLEAASGREALNVADRHQGGIDVVLSDVVMPDMGGIELHEKLSERRPLVGFVLTSGYSEAEVRGDLHASGVTFVPKPFTPDSLLRGVRDALNARLQGGPREGGRA